MSHFRAAKRKAAKLDKKALSKVEDAGATHDGEFFSLLATGRELKIDDDDEILRLFGEFIDGEVSEKNGWKGDSMGTHTVFTKSNGGVQDDAKLIADDLIYYLQPIGVPDKTKESGMNIWDFKINLSLKEDYIKHYENYGKEKA